MMNRINDWRLLFLLGLVPLILLMLDIQLNRLGANPIEAVNIRLGDWTLRFLCLSLSITPLRKMTDWKWPIRDRRMIGLFTFFYACLHVLSYLILDHALAWNMIYWDIIESPFILVGLIAFIIILLMGITSTKAWQKRLGTKWKKLHKLIYYAAIAALIHYAWQLKGNFANPLIYGIIIAFLLGFRVLVRWRNYNPISHSS